ncbi:hypothetical protein BO71DRAFT_434849 [Aspergillus ellipticus CBS 707.79]|uniref:Uncharacterized protein n=1 Tax=Aspergillus ellipticus CBS 707.79 TaxID=1448320 RepID=A0A319DEA8_9EURO|nr:hypothetical protein BO71DRAFT_434849 [Aspergillus ellipticus CBS 707.79]
MDVLGLVTPQHHEVTPRKSSDDGRLSRIQLRGESTSLVIPATPYQYLFNTDQGMTEDTFEGALLANGDKVDRFMELIHYKYNEDMPEWPLTAYNPHHRGGEDVWAVADVYVDTNFEDYRRRCAIRTPQGGCMLIPRKDEGLRIFLQVDEKGLADLEWMYMCVVFRLANFLGSEMRQFLIVRSMQIQSQPL